MSIDTLRLAVVYYPLTMLFVAVLAGFTLRDAVTLLVNAAVRVVRRYRRSRRPLPPPVPREPFGACQDCEAGFESLLPGDDCPCCGVPLSDSRASYSLLLSREQP